MELERVYNRLLSLEDIKKVCPIGHIKNFCREPHPDGRSDHFCSREKGHEGVHVDHNPDMTPEPSSYLIWRETDE